MGLFSHRQNNPGIPGIQRFIRRIRSEHPTRTRRPDATTHRANRDATKVRCRRCERKNPRGAGRCTVRDETLPREQTASSKRQNQKRRKRSPDDVQLPTSPGGGGRAGAGSGVGRRAGVSTRRSEHAPDGANGKRPLPAPARDRCILVRAWHLGASWCILVRARHHDRA
jgi:hypothetical protein